MAQKRDAVLQGMFYFRKDICKGITCSGLLGPVYAEQAAEAPLCSPWLAGGNAVVDGCSKAQSSAEPAAEEYALMSIDTIINGKVRPSGACAGSPSRQSL